MIEALGFLFLAHSDDLDLVEKTLGALLLLIGIHAAVWVFADFRLLARKRVTPEPAPYLWAIGVLLAWSVALPCYIFYRAKVAALPAAWRADSSQAVSRWRGFVRHGQTLLGFLLYTSIVLIAVMISLQLTARFGTLPSDGDLIDLMFGAASIALIGVTILAGFLAIVGWQQLKEHVDGVVDKKIKTEIRRLELMLDGRVKALTAIHWATIASAEAVRNADSEDRLVAFEDLDDPDSLKVAVRYAQDSISPLETAESPLAWPNKNNLGYFQAVYACSAGSDPQSIDAASALSLSDELLAHYETGQEIAYLLTYLKMRITFAQRLADLEGVDRKLNDLEKSDRLVRESPDPELLARRLRLVARYVEEYKNKHAALLETELERPAVDGVGEAARNLSVALWRRIWGAKSGG